MYKTNIPSKKRYSQAYHGTEKLDSIDDHLFFTCGSLVRELAYIHVYVVGTWHEFQGLIQNLKLAFMHGTWLKVQPKVQMRCPNPYLKPLPIFYTNPLSPQGKFGIEWKGSSLFSTVKGISQKPITVGSFFTSSSSF